MQALVDAVLRISANRRDADDVAPPFSIVRRAVARTTREALRADGAEDELVPLYEAENARLLEETAETRSQSDALLAVTGEECAAIEIERDAAREEVMNLNARLRFLEHLTKQSAPRPAIEVPDDFDDLQGWGDRALGPHIVLLP